MTSIPRPSSTTLQAAVCDKVVLVTGAASGIGLAMASLFAEHGATVVMVDLSLQRLEEVSSGLKGKTVPYECDITSWKQQTEMFEWCVQRYGKLDMVCCNAGIDPELVMASAERDQVKNKVVYNWLTDEVDNSGGSASLKQPSDAVFDVNVKGTMFGIKLAVHHMLRSGGGKIVVTGSAASYMGIPEQDTYDASKHALLGLVRSVSARPELKDSSISVSMISPWLTTTPLVACLPKSATDGALASSPEDVAWAAAYFATAPFEDVNGKCLWVQGQELQEVESSYQTWLQGLMRT